MKFHNLIIFALALLISIPASAINWDHYKKTACIAFIAATGYDFFTKEKLTVDEMETKRAISEEESTLTMCQRLFSEVWVGQAKDAFDEEKPATGIVGNCYQTTKDYILPVTGVIVLLEKTKRKLTAGLKTLGLEKVTLLIPQVPTMDPK